MTARHVFQHSFKKDFDCALKKNFFVLKTTEGSSEAFVLSIFLYIYIFFQNKDDY